MPRAKAEVDSTSADMTTEDIGLACSRVVWKYTRPNINTRTMMQMPEFWTDISKTLRGEPVSGIDVPGAEAPTPTLSALSPDSAEVGSPDIVLSCVGTGFTEESVIVFNGGEEPTVYVSETEITTVVKPSLASIALSVPVSVKTGEIYTNPIIFTFTAAPEADVTDIEGEVDDTDEDAPKRRRKRG